MLIFCYGSPKTENCNSFFSGKTSTNMLTGRIIQNTIEEIHKITSAPMALYDSQGNLICSVGKMKSRPKTADVTAFAHSEKAASENMARVRDQEETVYVVFVCESVPGAKMLAELAAMQLTSLQNSSSEDADRDNFIKNLLLDNLLMVDVYSLAKKFGMGESVKRAVILIGAEGKDADTGRIEAIARENDIVTAVDDHDVILICQLEEEEGYEALGRKAREAVRAAGPGMKAACGTIVKELKDVPRSYKEALTVKEIAGIFSPGKEIAVYSSLGIGRLIYQLPLPLCRTFIKEVFANRPPDYFDEETITTVNKFFENNLNVSETSRQLYIHRNTLVYRLDKICKMTGLDLRLFEDAITFKIALMVVQYMKYTENLE